MKKVARKKAEEWISERVSWAEQISNSDPDFRDYAGSDFTTANKMAKIDTLLKILDKKHPLRTLLKFQRLYLLQRKKAEFVSLRAGEISLLGFLRGSKPYDIKAKLDEIQINL